MNVANRSARCTPKPPRIKIHSTCPELAEGLHRFFSALSALSAVNYLNWRLLWKPTKLPLAWL